MTLTLEIKNVAGFAGTKSFKGIKRGLNRVRSPNAMGKTSFTKALELLALSEQELSGKGHYSNLYIGSEEPIVVKLSGDLTNERKFRRIGTRDLRLVEGEPIGYDGRRIVNVCFATPGNPLIEDVLEGKPILDYIKMFAGIGDYDKVADVLDGVKDNILAKLQHYRDALNRLEEMGKIRNETREGLEDLRKKLAKMPVLDEKAIFEDWGHYNRKKGELENKSKEIADVRFQIAALEENIEELESEVGSLERRIELIKKRHPKLEARLEEIGNLEPKKEAELQNIKIQKARAEEKLESAQRSEVLLKKYGENVCYACGKKMNRAELETWSTKVEGELDDLNRAGKELNRELEDLKEDRRILERDLEERGECQERLRQNQRSLGNRERDMRERRKTLVSLEEDRGELMKEIADLSKSEEMYKKFEKHQNLLASIRQREGDVTRFEERIKGLGKETLGVEEYRGKHEFLEELIHYLDARKEKLIEEIRSTFNARVIELYRKLGFKDFEDIEITPDYRITVTRKKDGKMVEDFPLEALSTSERLTISIALLLSAKQSYVRDFPFFILDELITSYDPARFEAVKEYFKRSEDYVILTELSEKAKEVEVVTET